LAKTRGKILLIEGKRSDHPSFFSGLTRKGYEVESVGSGKSAQERLRAIQPNVVLVDAASMRTSGKRICQSIREDAPGVPVLLVVDADYDHMDRLEADVILAQPFTLQKLLNRLRPLLPSDEKDVFKVGPIHLDVEHRWARCQDRQTQLTPRLVMLLKALMERPGEVIERTELFRVVWETEYTGDTRTLDVHVSWLRQALEEDARHPRFIKTVRGVGYRLDVETKKRK